MSDALPLRMSLLRLLAVSGSARTGQDLLKELKTDYGQERQCNMFVVLDHLFNMASLGLVGFRNERLLEGGELAIDFFITAEGRARSKYFPKQWQFN